MNKKIFVVITVLTGLFALSPVTVFAQPKPVTKPAPLQCTTQNKAGEKMTYLVGAGKLSTAEKKRIREKWGELIIPKGETERAREIRQRAINYQQSLRDAMTQSLETWKKVNPQATAEQIEQQRRRRDERLSFKFNKNSEESKERRAAKSWDWRTALDV